VAQKRLIAGLFWSLGLCTLGIDASPHTNYLQIFKKRPEPLGSGGAHRCALRTSTLRFRIPSEGGRIIAMSCNPSTFTLSATFSPFRVATQAARGAQYSPDWSLVNELSFLFLMALPGLFSKQFCSAPAVPPSARGSLGATTLCRIATTTPAACRPWDRRRWST